MAEQKPEWEKELSELRREVIEARNLVIKTDNLLKNLHAELKSVGKRQEDFQRRQWISSGVAYALFAVLAVVGASMVASSRMASATAERDRLEQSNKELTTAMEKQKSETASASASVNAANSVYRMMTSLPGDERLKGIDALVRLDQSKLTPLEKQALNDRAELLRKEVGQSAFDRGKQAFRRNEFTAAAEDLARFMAMNPPPAEQLEAAFFLGTSYSQLRKFDLAVPLLSRFVTENRNSKSRDYAMVMLAQALEASGQPEKAAEIARDGLGTYPNSQFAPQLRTRLAAAKRAINTQNGVAPGGPEAAVPGLGVPAAPSPLTTVAAPKPTAAAPSAAKPGAATAKPAGK